MGRALRFAGVLPTLLVAHNVADHIVQTDHQAAAKTTSWAAMAGHVGSYQATQAVAVAAVGVLTGQRLRIRDVVLGGLFSAATHAFLDRRWPVRKALQVTGSPNFADMTTPLHGMYLADQALHHGCLLVSALLMSKGGAS
jgi:hypothetical protein